MNYIVVTYIAMEMISNININHRALVFLGPKGHYRVRVLNIFLFLR